MRELTEPQESGVSDKPFAVELRHIRKAWPGVVANDDVNLSVRQGEIHALVGENGAGKSTLMNILYGLIKPNSGEIYVHGQLAQINGPRDAIRLSIGMVHQHFMLIPPMTVAENIVLGYEPGGTFSPYQGQEARHVDVYASCSSSLYKPAKSLSDVRLLGSPAQPCNRSPVRY